MSRNHPWYQDNPMGDPFGGPAFGKYQDPSVLGLIGSLGGAAIGASGAQGAAGAQIGAANQANQILQGTTGQAIGAQNQMVGSLAQLLNPQITVGNQAQQALQAGLGLPQTALPGGTTLGAATSGPLSNLFTPFSFTADQYKQSPGYQFALQQGLGTIQNNAAAKGMLLSPNTIKDLEAYGTGLASQDYQQAYQNAATADAQNRSNILNTLGMQAGQGATATSGLASGIGTAGTNIANLYSGLGGALGGNILGAGNAAAAGRIGATNALTGGMGNISNLLSAYRLMGGGGGGLGAGLGDLLSGISPGAAGGLGDALGMSIGGTYGPSTQAGLDALISSFNGGTATAAGAGAAESGAAAGAGAGGGGGGAAGLGAAAGFAAPLGLFAGGMLLANAGGTSPSEVTSGLRSLMSEAIPSLQAAGAPGGTGLSPGFGVASYTGPVPWQWDQSSGQRVAGAITPWDQYAANFYNQTNPTGSFSPSDWQTIRQYYDWASQNQQQITSALNSAGRVDNSSGGG
jgi:hypothetical protein